MTAISPPLPSTPGRGADPVTPPLSRGAAAVLPALRAAAERTGVDFGALFHTARLESAFNPGARAATSSATGLFQFIDSTWLSTLAAHGPRHGIEAANRAEALALRRDPAVAALMAAEHMADNGRRLAEGLGRAATGLDLYLAHFLGSGGALRFLEGLAAAPDAAAASLLPAAARANRAIFYDRAGAPRSVRAVHDLLADRFADTRPGRPPGAAAPAAAAPAPTPAKALAPTAAPEPPEARRAAQLAYLLLAELGG